MSTHVPLRSISPTRLKPGEVIFVETKHNCYALRIRNGARVSFTGGRYVGPIEALVLSDAITVGEDLMIQCDGDNHPVRTSPIVSISVSLS